MQIMKSPMKYVITTETDFASEVTAIDLAILASRKQQHQTSHQDQTQVTTGLLPVTKVKAVNGWLEGHAGSSTGELGSKNLIVEQTKQPAAQTDLTSSQPTQCRVFPP